MSYAQKVQYSSTACTARSSGNPPVLAPCVESTDCNGHGLSGGVREVLGGTAGTPNHFPTASAWILAHGGSRKITGKVSVIGGFTINTSISFEGADVRISPDAKITVNALATMTSTGTKYYACEGLWKGIEALGTLNFQGDVIEDAKVAIAFVSSSKPSSINGVTFKRNVIGIAYGGHKAIPGNFAFKSFSGNTFECEKRLNRVNGMPNMYRWGTSGITIMGGTLNINRGTGNVFKGKIRVGIEVVNRASSIISGCEFDKIDYKASADCDEATIFNDNLHSLRGTPLFDNSAGYGIYAENSTLNATNNSFTNCAGGGIRTSNSKMDATKNILSFVGTELPTTPTAIANLTTSQRELNHLILCETPGSNTVNISDNTFFPIHLMTTSKACIYVDQSLRSAIIGNNNISFLNAGSPYGAGIMHGIQINGQAVNSATNVTFVTNNNIATMSAAPKNTGILIENARKVEVKKNVLTNYGTLPNFDVAGIYLRNSSECEVLENNVDGDLKKTGHTKTQGIAYHFKSLGAKLYAEKNIVARNTADYIPFGFVFDGNCDKSQFICNTMKSCKTRLLLAKSKTSPETAIGVQKSASGLAFLDTYNGVLAHQYVDAKHDGAKPKLSQFFYKDDGYPFDPQIVVIAGGLPKSEWFFKDPFVRLNTCGTSNLTMEGTSDISALEEEIINGGMTAIEQTPYVWEYEKALFDKLDTRSELRVGFPAREAFYNAKAATSLPSFVAVGKGIDNLFVLSNEDQLQLNNLHTQLEEAQALYNSYLTQGLMTFEDEPWTEAAIAGLSEHTQSIANFEEQIATKWLAIKATQQARATELLAANEQLNAVKVYEQATKKWQELYLKAFLNQGLANENDLAELRLLAGTCPSVVGSTVYYSRMLLPSCEQANFDDSACGNAGNGSKVVKNTTVASVLYPNPANDEVSIRLTTMQPLNVIIIDINGRVMTSQATNGNATVVINTSQYPNGIYTIQYSDATIAVQKLIIQH